ncbi:MAG TPA: hypothetical protein VF244_09270 [Acidimicrobiales bacterium]
MNIQASKPTIADRYLFASFEAWLAWLALYAGLSYFVPLPSSGSAAAVQAVVPSIVTLWSALYSLGGFLTLLGIGRRSPRIEGSGLCLVAGGVAVSCIALLAAGALVVPTVSLQATLALACLARLKILWRL